MSDEQHIDELIIRYLQQDIDEDELRILEAWLEEDAGHKAHFFQMKNVSDTSRRSFLPNEEIAESSWQKMKPRILAMQENDSPNQSIRIDWLVYRKYVAIIIIALGIGWGIGEFRGHINQAFMAENTTVYNEIRVEKGGRANTILLSDGTKVVLNAATTFRYPSNFDSKDRKVFLNGEAYFEVAKNTEKPFVVKLNKQDITVLGTKFNIEAYSEDSYSIVTLLSGSIALEAFNEKGESMSRMFLKPNQRAYADNLTGSVSIQNTDATLSNAWVKGDYKFKDEPFNSIAKRLEYYYGVKIHLENESLKREKYTGTFSLEQDIKDVLQIIDYEKRFVIRFEKKDIYITKE